MFKLQDMRDRKQIRAVGYVFIIFVLISFVFFYMQKGSGRPGYEKTVNVARIKSSGLNPLQSWEFITNTGLKEAENGLKQQYTANLPQTYTQFFDRRKAGSTDRLVSSMIGQDEVIAELGNRSVLNRYAGELGFEVPRIQVKQYFLQNMPGINDQYLAMMAQSQGMTTAQYVEKTRRQLQDSQMLDIVGLTAEASLFELWQEYSLAHEKLTLKLAAFPEVRLEKQVVVTEAGLQDFLEAHRERFHKPARRRYAYVKKTSEEIAEGIKADDATLKAWYQQNQVRYMRPAGYQTEDIYIPLAGDTTTTAARTVLQGEREAAAQSTDWNAFVERLKQKHPQVQVYHRKPSTYFDSKSEERSAAYRAEMTRLKDKETSLPVIDEEGAFLLRVTDRREEGVEPFDKIKTQIMKDYRDGKVKEESVKFHQALKDELAKGAHTTMQSFAKAVALDDQLTTRVEQNAEYIPGVGNLLNAQDNLRGLKLNEFSDAIQMPDQAEVVMQVVEDAPESDPPLSEIRAEVEAALRADEARALAKTAAENALNLVKGGAPFNEALKDAPVAPLQTDPIERGDDIKSLDAPMLDFKEQTVSIDKDSAGVSAYGTSKDEIHGYAVWQVVKIEPASREKFEADRAKFQTDYVALQREAIKREWLETRRKQLGFEILTPEAKPETKEAPKETAKAEEK